MNKSTMYSCYELVIILLVYCSSESIDSDRGTFVWPETDSNMRAIVACPYGPNGVTVSRSCTSNGYWESPNVTRCLTAISSGFKNISKVNINYFLFY